MTTTCTSATSYRCWFFRRAAATTLSTNKMGTHTTNLSSFQFRGGVSLGDPNGPSSGDEQDEQPASTLSASLVSVKPAAGSAALTRPASPSHSVAPGTLKPAVLGPPHTNSTTTWDIHHFFECGSRAKETRTVCKLCKYMLSFDVVTTYS